MALSTVVSLDRTAAMVFDTDGVITDTARVHAAAWKRVFDAFLRDRATRSGERFRPFDTDEDYLLHVDGKPRADGVRDPDPPRVRPAGYRDGLGGLARRTRLTVRAGPGL